ncbi:MAG: hypothetical protein ABI036_11350, partial [Fibrobacteria bacterium]
VVVVGGFTVFYQYQKRASISRFEEADSLYQAGKIKDAGKLYEELKSAQYLTNKYDSIIYARLDTIETLRELQNALVAETRKKAVPGGAAAMGPILDKVPHKELLSDEDKAWVDSVIGEAKLAVATPATPGPAASIKAAKPPAGETPSAASKKP